MCLVAAVVSILKDHFRFQLEAKRKNISTLRLACIKKIAEKVDVTIVESLISHVTRKCISISIKYFKYIMWTLDICERRLTYFNLTLILMNSSIINIFKWRIVIFS